MKQKSKKYIAVIVLTIIIIILGMLMVLHFVNNNNQSQENENNKIVLNGISCGNNCIEYSNIYDVNKEYLINYSDREMKILVNLFNSEEYDNSSLSILVNENEIYKITDFTTNVKIFKFKDIYVVEYVQSMTQCGNTIDILINKNGKLIELPVSDMSDTFVDENNYKRSPSIMRAEFIEDTNSIIIYKETCSMCPNEEYQIGFKYIFSLESGMLKLQKKENIYCHE